MSLALVSHKAALLVPPWNLNELWRRARAVPSLDLRFAENKSLVDAVTGAQLTFTRSSNATYVDSDGLIKTASANVPRFDHNPLTGESLGLLVEEQTTNMLQQSETFQTTWSPFRASVSANAIASPAGSITADRIVEDTTASNSHGIQQLNLTFVSGTTYTFSVYAKADDRQNVRFTISAAAFGTSNVAQFNLSAGTTTVVSAGVTATISALPNGWYRLTMTSTATTSATSSVSYSIGENATSTIAVYTGNGSSGLYLWGAQLEATAFPTSYILTTTAAATRSADVASITGTNFSSWYRQDEGTVFGTYVGINNISGGTRRLIEIGTSGLTADRIILGYNTTTNSRLLVVVGGATQADITPIAIQGAQVSVSAAYKANDFQQSVNGNLSAADTSGSVPSVAAMAIGADFVQAANTALNGTIRRLTYWPVRLGNEVLQRITQ